MKSASGCEDRILLDCVVCVELCDRSERCSIISNSVWVGGFVVEGQRMRDCCDVGRLPTM